MHPLVQIELRDRELTDSVDAALAESARLSGPWLACRVGCTECCKGPFVITQLDALRLRRGLQALRSNDPERALRVFERASRLAEHLEDACDPMSAIGDEEPCPALDPVTGACDLYEYRPITCRVFGPPVALSGGVIGVCELCFDGASPEEINVCRSEADPDDLEPELVAEAERETGLSGDTLVVLALAR